MSDVVDLEGWTEESKEQRLNTDLTKNPDWNLLDYGKNWTKFFKKVSYWFYLKFENQSFLVKISLSF